MLLRAVDHQSFGVLGHVTKHRIGTAAASHSRAVTSHKTLREILPLVCCNSAVACIAESVNFPISGQPPAYVAYVAPTS